MSASYSWLAGGNGLGEHIDSYQSGGKRCPKCKLPDSVRQLKTPRQIVVCQTPVLSLPLLPHKLVWTCSSEKCGWRGSSDWQPLPTKGEINPMHQIAESWHRPPAAVANLSFRLPTLHLNTSMSKLPERDSS